MFTRTALFVVAFVGVVLVAGCSKLSGDPANAEMTADEKQLIDNQLAKIDVSSTSLSECRKSIIRLADLDALPKTGGGKKYVLEKWEEYKGILDRRIQQLLTDYAKQQLSFELIRKNYQSRVTAEMGRDWEVVSLDDAKVYFNPSGTTVVVNMDHVLSLREHTGWFRSDNFATKRAQQSITFSLANGIDASDDITQSTTVTFTP